MIDLEVGITKEQLSKLEKYGINGIEASVRSYGETMTIGTLETKDWHVNINISPKEQPKPRTKTEYVKCDYGKRWERVKDVEDGVELYVENPFVSNTKYLHATFEHAISDCKLYRKVEKEIDWQVEVEEFIAAMQFNGKSTPISCIAFAGNDDKKNELIKFCRLVESLTRHIEV